MPTDEQPVWQTHVDILRWRAMHQPNRLAYGFLADGESVTDHLTYVELDDQARRIAGHLQQVSARGERALLLYPQGLEYVAAFVGCMYAGIVAVPAYPPGSQRSFQRIETIVRDAQATTVLTTAPLLANLRRSADVFVGLQDVHWVATDALPDDASGSWHEPGIAAEDLAFLQYTSGSTSDPKGVMVSYGNLIHNMLMMSERWKLTAMSVGVSWLPLFHDMGLIAGCLLPLACGFPVYLMAPATFVQRPGSWLRAITRFGGTMSCAPNFAYELCVRKITSDERAQLDLRTWEIAVNGAEPIHYDTLDRFVEMFEPCGFRKIVFSPGYGLAEGTLMVAASAFGALPVYESFDVGQLEVRRFRHASETAGRILVGCGPVGLDQQVAIVNPETMTRCQDDEIGEIWVKGASVAQGYWKRPLETALTFNAFLSESGDGPFLRTGDLGFLQNQELFVAGRLKDMIIIRGRNIYPQDIERTTSSAHPALRAGGGAAFSLQVSGEERLVVVQEVERYHQQWEMQDIFAAIRGAISTEHEVAVYAIILINATTLPKTSSGKVQRSASRQKFLDLKLDVVAQWIEPAIEVAPDDQPAASDASMPRYTIGQIRDWLAVRLSRRLGIKREQIDVRAPLAHYGLDSLAIVQITDELEKWLGQALSPTLAYEYPSIEALASALAQTTTKLVRASIPETSASSLTEGIAVVGMGCRFPGAPGLEAFWQLLQEGKEAISSIPPDRWNVEQFYDADPGAPGKMYTRAGGFLEDVRGFDANFFGISPREAARMDPQQRLLLEVTWEALEHFGLSANKLAGSRTGVFVGMVQTSEYGQMQVHSGQTAALDDPYYGIGSSASIAAGRLAYFFDLHGPTMTVDTACSSSLVALHLACQSLRNHECDLALVGGVNVLLSPESMVNACKMRMLAVDGRCKTFDAAADGYAIAEGCGVVVLRRETDAQAKGENTLAVIRGSAVNQDGRSNGITAPNKLAQVAVIQQALQNASMDPLQVSYVETHGSGTALGDSIEVEALASVLGEDRSLDQPVLIGSVKTNIGHLIGAAGMAGFIKTVLSLQHRQIPPHLNLQTPTPYVPWQQLPLRIATTLTPWSSRTELRVAGVSSFGWSGTNAHVVLEEASACESAPLRDSYHLLLFSAKSASALNTLFQHYAVYLRHQPEVDLADIAYTSQTGRATLDYRSILVCRDREDAIAALETPASRRVLIRFSTEHDRPVVFLFAGVGEQYRGMGRALYEQQPFFRQIVWDCCQYVQERHGLDLLPVLGLEGEKGGETGKGAGLDLRALLRRGAGASQARREVQPTELAHPSVFVLEYALARLLMQWGIVPQVVMGYSLGEYVASCISGALSWQDALSLVTRRARLISQLPGGRMLAVALSEQEAQEYLGDGVELAAVNAPQMCVLAGGVEEMEGVKKRLAEQGRVWQEIAVEHAFHTQSLREIGQEMRELVEQVRWQEPAIPLISNVTGNWLRAGEGRTGEYWVEQMCSTVRWKEGVGRMLEGGEQIVIEIGAGQTLGSFVRQHEGWKREGREQVVLGVLGTEQERQEEEQGWWTALGKVWLAGGRVDWEQGWQGERRRVVLPGYPFEHQRYWIESQKSSVDTTQRSEPATRSDVAHWFYAPTWKRSNVQPLSEIPVGIQQRWLVFVDECGIAEALIEKLHLSGHEIITVTASQSFNQRSNESYAIDPYSKADYNELFLSLQQAQKMPQCIVHCWNITMRASIVEEMENMAAAQYHGFYSLLFLAQALGHLHVLQKMSLLVCTNNAYDVIGGEILYPEKAVLPGLCKVLAQEYPNLNCRCIDIAVTSQTDEERKNIGLNLLAETDAFLLEEVVAYRAGRRWLPAFEPVSLEKLMHRPQPLREKGVYMITGGLGGLGLHVAEYVAKTAHATLILVSRTAFPPREQWSRWLAEHSEDAEDGPISEKIRRLLRLEEYGASVAIFQADVSDMERMREVIAHVHDQFGQIAGAFHLAGVPGHGMLQTKTTEAVELVFAPKMKGTLVLQKLLQAEPLDFLVLYSSSVAILGGWGEGDYAAANAFLAALAHYNAAHNGVPTYAIDWGLWSWDSWQEKMFASIPATYNRVHQMREQYGITFQEGDAALSRILTSGLPQLLVLPQGIEKAGQQVRALWDMTDSEAASAHVSSPEVLYPRPALHTPYVGPVTPLEQRIATIWQTCLGIELVGVHDHFFELGGNSLIGMLVISQLQKELDIPLSVAVLFESPTIALLAETLQAKEEPAAIQEMQKSSSRGKMRKERMKSQKRSH